jgi:prepilin-type N-terminal cleavage/methylation domain-containing protein
LSLVDDSGRQHSDYNVMEREPVPTTMVRANWSQMRLPARGPRGWTLIELMAVMALLAIAMLIGGLSVYRGKALSQQLACQDNMRAIHSALQIYWAKNGRTYPANQTEFEQFLRAPAYFVNGELRCPSDQSRSLHYQYHYTPSPTPVPGDVTITCPVAGSGHGTM